MSVISNQAHTFDPSNHSDIKWFLEDAKKNGCKVSVIEQPNGSPGLLIIGGNPSDDHLAITDQHSCKIAETIHAMNGGRYV